MKRWSSWLSWLLIFALLTGCASVGSYVKEQYPLIDVQGKGKDAARIYLAENKDVPTVAKELAQQQRPIEQSEVATDQMFLVYNNQIIHLQQDPDNEANTRIEFNSIEYAQKNYDISFLEAYLAASLLQSLFGDYDHSYPSRGPADSGGIAGSSGPSKKSPAQDNHSTTKPDTSDRKGTFTTKGGLGGSNDGSAGKASKPESGSAGGLFSPPSTSGSSGSFTTKSNAENKSSGSSSIRKNDGSTPNFKISKPKTSKRSGSFKIRRR